VTSFLFLAAYVTREMQLSVNDSSFDRILLGVVANKFSEVSEERTISIFMGNELVWANAEVIWRKDFVGYVESLR